MSSSRVIPRSRVPSTHIARPVAGSARPQQKEADVAKLATSTTSIDSIGGSDSHGLNTSVASLEEGIFHMELGDSPSKAQRADKKLAEKHQRLVMKANDDAKTSKKNHQEKARQHKIDDAEANEAIEKNYQIQLIASLTVLRTAIPHIMQRNHGMVVWSSVSNFKAELKANGYVDLNRKVDQWTSEPFDPARTSVIHAEIDRQIEAFRKSISTYTYGHPHALGTDAVALLLQTAEPRETKKAAPDNVQQKAQNAGSSHAATTMALVAAAASNHAAGTQRSPSISRMPGVGPRQTPPVSVVSFGSLDQDPQVHQWTLEHNLNQLDEESAKRRAARLAVGSADSLVGSPTLQEATAAWQAEQARAAQQAAAEDEKLTVAVATPAAPIVTHEAAGFSIRIYGSFFSAVTAAASTVPAAPAVMATGHGPAAAPAPADEDWEHLYAHSPSTTVGPA